MLSIILQVALVTSALASVAPSQEMRSRGYGRAEIYGVPFFDHSRQHREETPHITHCRCFCERVRSDHEVAGSSAGDDAKANSRGIRSLSISVTPSGRSENR